MRSSTLALLFLAAVAVLALAATSVDASQASSLESAHPSVGVAGARRFSGVSKMRAAMLKPKKNTGKKSSPLGKKKNTSSKRAGKATGGKKVTADQKGLPPSSKSTSSGPKVGSGAIKYTYSQRTGVFTFNDGKTARGYSGRAKGLNNPAMQHVRAPCQSGAQCDRVDAGAIPRGQYTVSFVTPSGHKRGAWTIGLAPAPSNSMMGRDGFLIHGANRRDTATNKVSSTGCIVMPVGDRQKVKRGAILTVTS